MKKICNVCGYSPENINTRECPNCGSYDFKIIQSDSGIGIGTRFRIRK